MVCSKPSHSSESTKVAVLFFIIRECMSIYCLLSYPLRSLNFENIHTWPWLKLVPEYQQNKKCVGITKYKFNYKSREAKLFYIWSRSVRLKNTSTKNPVFNQFCNNLCLFLFRLIFFISSSDTLQVLLFVCPSICF